MGRREDVSSIGSTLSWMRRIRKSGVRPGLSGGEPPTAWFWTRRSSTGMISYALPPIIFTLLEDVRDGQFSKEYKSEAAAWRDLSYALMKLISTNPQARQEIRESL